MSYLLICVSYVILPVAPFTLLLLRYTAMREPLVMSVFRLSGYLGDLLMFNRQRKECLTS